MGDEIQDIEDTGLRRRSQTGMEARWERWILDTLNLLNVWPIPVYTCDRDGDNRRLMEIPERLGIAHKRYVDALSMRDRADRSLRETREILGRRTADFVKAADVIEQAYRNLMLQDDEGKMNEALEALHTWIAEFRPYVLKEDEDEESA